MKKTGNPEKNKLIKALDKLWGEVVKERCFHTCVVCLCEGKRSPSEVDPHHMERRGHKATRWLVENGVALCRKHHSMAEEKKIIIVAPQYIQDLAKTNKHFLVSELEEIFQDLTKTLIQFKQEKMLDNIVLGNCVRKIDCKIKYPDKGAPTR